MKGCVKTLNELALICNEVRSRGKKVVTTNGTFDLLHPGHVATLREAKGCGDILIVAINSDASVKRLKGGGRPIFSETDRATMLCALRWVDYVTVFPEDTPLRVIHALTPDCHVKGGTSVQGNIDAEREAVEAHGGRLVILGMQGGYSTTKIIEACRRASA